MRKVHYGWDTAYPESNEAAEWGTACGMDTFVRFAPRWADVTCKRCLKRGTKTGGTENG